MKRDLLFALSLLFFAAPALNAVEPDVPQGDVKQSSFSASKIFPGTVRDYWVYVPKQYDATKPACVYVNQDGIQFNAPVVFDRLIAAKEMPVTIGVFVTPGRVKAPNENSLDRFNRSYEYDGLGDNYARFLLEELLPHIEKEHKLNLSHSGNDRAIGGTSSGAVCAFTAAWERPDAFTRVFSGVGTYVGLRGANDYPTLVRKYEPKPIRIFLEDGSNDQNIYAGDWWMANQEMERALTFAGYEVNHAWGDGGHNGKHATEVFPDAMRWLWKDWPAPVKPGAGSPQLKEILLPGEEWKQVGGDFINTEGMAANSKGEIFFIGSSVPSLKSKTYKVGLDGTISVFLADNNLARKQAFGPDGQLYVLSLDGLVAFDEGGKSTKILPGFFNGVIMRHDGKIYGTVSGRPSGILQSEAVWLLDSKGEKRLVDSGVQQASGLALSPDQSLLYVADFASHWVYSYQIAPDGSLTQRQKYFHLHVPDAGDCAGAIGMAVDRDGRLYVATSMGIQVCDQAGRVNCIVPFPLGDEERFVRFGVTSLAFGGEKFDVLYAACGDKIYSRKLKTVGARAFEPPFKPAPPKL